jgi:hypothetical protein
MFVCHVMLTIITNLQPILVIDAKLYYKDACNALIQPVCYVSMDIIILELFVRNVFKVMVAKDA